LKDKPDRPYWVTELLFEIGRLKRDVYWLRVTVYFVILPLLFTILAKLLSS